MRLNIFYLFLILVFTIPFNTFANNPKEDKLTSLFNTEPGGNPVQIVIHGNLLVVVHGDDRIDIICEPPYEPICFYDVIWYNSSGEQLERVITLNDTDQTEFNISTDPVVTTDENGVKHYSFTID